MPIVVGQLGVIVLGFADTMMVGHYSTGSLAAASFVNNIFTLVTVMLMGFSYGITPVVGAFFARKEYAEAGASLKNALVANLAFGGVLIVLSSVFYCFLGDIGQPEELLPLIRPYYVVVLLSMAFVVLFNVMRQFTDGIMQTKTAMWILLGGNAFNIVFNYFLIYGKMGFPEMGLLGAGISTLASRVLMVFAYMWLLLRSRRYAAYREGFFREKANAPGIRKVAKVSFPVALQMGTETGTFTASAVMVGWLGALELASYQVMVTVGMLGFMFYYSIGAAIAIRVASFTGLDDRKGVLQAANAGYHLLLLLAFMASVAFYVFAEPIIRIFTSDNEVVAMAIALIPPLILYQFGDATQICFANALRGTSHVMSMMWFAFISYVLVGIPCSYLLGFTFGLGESGIFLSFSVSLFTAAILFYVQFRKVTRLKAI